MRIGCIIFPSFTVQVERANTPSIKKGPAIIGGYPHEKKSVYEASEEALKKGVRPGMPLREAYGLCPEATFLPLDEEKYILEFETILTILYSFSPLLERTSLGHAFIGLPQNTDELGFGKRISTLIKNKTSLDSSLGFASTKFVAWAACQMIGLGQVVKVPDQEEENFLRDLSLDLLPVSNETLRRFNLLGLKTMGQLASLPLKTIDREFGNQSRLLWDLAKGIDRSRIKRWTPEQLLEESHSFETPAEDYQQLLEKVDSLLIKLVSKLSKRNQKSGKLVVTLALANQSPLTKVLHFKDPLSSKERMMERFRHWMDETKLEGPVVEIKLSLADLRPEEGAQMDLLNRELKTKSLTTTLKSLRVRFGKGAVKRVVLSESGARLPEESFKFIEFG